MQQTHTSHNDSLRNRQSWQAMPCVPPCIYILTSGDVRHRTKPFCSLCRISMSPFCLVFRAVLFLLTLVHFVRAVETHRRGWSSFPLVAKAVGPMTTLLVVVRGSSMWTETLSCNRTIARGRYSAGTKRHNAYGQAKSIQAASNLCNSGRRASRTTEHGSGSLPGLRYPRPGLGSALH